MVQKEVRLGRMGEITRHQAIERADSIFKDYRASGISPWAQRMDKPRDVSRIADRAKREWYVRKYSEQDGRCAICENPRPHLYIDHCHATGKLRALLCSRCNTGIGQLQDSPELIRKAAEYIEHFKHSLDADQ